MTSQITNADYHFVNQLLLKLMLENPEEVISKITNAQTYINEHYTPKAIGLKWKRVYDRLHK